MNHHTANSISNQQRIIQKHRTGTDCFSAFNLLTSDVLFEELENRLPEHRERLFPPTETLAMFVAQAKGGGIYFTEHLSNNIRSEHKLAVGKREKVTH